MRIENGFRQALKGMHVKLKSTRDECQRHGVAKPRVEEHAKRALEPWVQNGSRQAL